MNLKKINTLTTLLATGVWLHPLLTIHPANAASIRLLGLTDNNTLVSFDLSQPTRTRTTSITGVDGTLVGIDFRPANGSLFGITTNAIYTINPSSGQATLVSNNPAPFTLTGTSFGVDFNPNPDRIRVVSNTGQNLRLNPNTGGIAINPNGTPANDAPLQYDQTDPNFNANTSPNIVAAAYTNSFAPSPDVANRRTTLYLIDADRDLLLTQGSVDFLPSDPQPPAVSPNSGRLFTIGSLGTGIDFGATVGFDILSIRDGKSSTNTAFAASGSTLYQIALTGTNAGQATSLGTIGNGDRTFIGLTATSVPEPGTIGALLGLCTASLASQLRRR